MQAIVIVYANIQFSMLGISSMSTITVCAGKNLAIGKQYFHMPEESSIEHKRLRWRKILTSTFSICGTRVLCIALYTHQYYITLWNGCNWQKITVSVSAINITLENGWCNWWKSQLECYSYISNRINWSCKYYRH